MDRSGGSLLLLGVMLLTTGAVQLPADVPAESRRIVVRSQLDAVSTHPNARLEMTWVGGRPLEESEKVRSFDLGKAPAELAVNLPDETVWQLQISGDGLYSPATLVGLLGENDPTEVVLPVYPTVSLTATLRLSDDTTPSEATEATLRFQPVSSSGVPEAGEVECTLAEGRVICPVPRAPAAHLDLKLRVPGYASHFSWEREIPEDGLDLGEVDFIEGGSLVGRLEPETGELPEAVSIRLVPGGVADSQRADPEAEREALLVDRTEADERGYFHFLGIAAGSYRLRVEADGFAPLLTLPILLTGSTEVELREPLRLARPLELVVRVAPEVDSQGEPWYLTLLSMTGGRGELLDRGRPDADGAWRSTPLPAGTYQIIVADGAGGRVALEEVFLSSGREEQFIRLDAVAVAGQVRLGEDPIRGAHVYFGGRSGPVSILVKTDEEGRFEGVLPRSGAWDVDIQAFQPDIARRLEAIDVTAVSEVAWVQIDLPTTEVSGEVVDAEGRSVENAHVFLVSVHQRPVQTQTDPEGEFSFHGLSPGSYRVEARHIRSDSEAVAEGEWLDLDEEDRVTVKLVIRDQRRVTGRVVAAGRPVPGVSILPSSQVVPLFVSPVRSSPDGTFDIELPPELDRVTLTAMLPGALLFHEEMAVPPDGVMEVSLEYAGGGRLILSGIEPFRRSGPVPSIIVRDGIQQVSLATLTDWARMNGAATGESFEVPNMPPGVYALCRQITGDCAEGFLAPGGELFLANPSEKPSRKEIEE